MTDVWDSMNIDVLIPSQIWTLTYWEKYLASYGVCLGDFNIGMARAMQKDVGNTSTDCFLQSLHTSNAIKNTYDINFYTNRSFNYPDFQNHLSQIAIGLTDQFNAC